MAAETAVDPLLLFLPESAATWCKKKDQDKYNYSAQKVLLFLFRP
jgi:hypothetical protein